jgi:putative ABC transport system ATP-binding protein
MASPPQAARQAGPSQARSSPWALQTEGVTKIYRLSRTIEYQALRGVDLRVAHGEFVALVGPSGSGKSTLLNLLGTLDRPTTGRITIEGTDTTQLNDNQLAELRNRRIGFVFQSYSLIGRMNALENVAFPLVPLGVPKPEREQRARAMLERVGLGHRLRNRPTELSGGEQQRVAVARALVNEPSILLTDEPTGALDTVTSKAILQLLQDLHANTGVTLVLVTHDLSLAATAQRIVRLRDGQVEGEGLPPPAVAPLGGAVA